MRRAALLFIKKDGKILFVHRAPHRTSIPNRWSLPSETLIADEKIEEAVKRCAWHELALRVSLDKVVHEHHYKDDKEDKILYFCLCDINKGNVAIQHTGELDDFVWLSIDDFLNKFEDSQIGHGLQYVRKNRDKFDL
ncbi:MAG: NUDIX domain-containing protein [Candidatus Micrarchaeota archaeon]